MDKSTPVKAKTTVRHGKYGGIERRCPSCLERFYRRVKECPHCGQAIKQWWTGKGTGEVKNLRK